MTDTKEELVLPELSDESMAKLDEAAKQIYVNLKRSGRKGSAEELLDSAIVLGIFAIFNPKNVPMQEEQIETVWKAYQNWIRKRVFN